MSWFARDISARLRAQELLARIQRELASAAHLAGKAEVATDVLHNVGNVLASLDSTAQLVAERVQGSRVAMFRRALAALPAAPPGDDSGADVRAYLALLTEQLEREHAETLTDLQTLGRHLEHVGSVIARQQAYAHSVPLVEAVRVEEVIADAVRMSEASLVRHGVAIAVESTVASTVMLDRHKVIEILTNFLANSRQALDASTTADKRILVRARRNTGGKLQIDVIDNGVGIPADELDRLFSYGFTTKRGGHGFGLAGSLLTARALEGTARGTSAGAGTGATFTVELPFRTAPQERAA